MEYSVFTGTKDVTMNLREGEALSIDVETKKVIVSWKSIIKKNDRDILFQIKNADKNKQKKKNNIKFMHAFDLKMFSEN